MLKAFLKLQDSFKSFVISGEIPIALSNVQRKSDIISPTAFCINYNNYTKPGNIFLQQRQMPLLTPALFLHNILVDCPLEQTFFYLLKYLHHNHQYNYHEYKSNPGICKYSKFGILFYKITHSGTTAIHLSEYEHYK